MTPACTPGVRSSFSGSLDWAAGASGVGAGADGQGGVGIRPAVTVTPLVGASVTVRRADGTAIGTATTGADGHVTFKPCDIAGPYLVEVKGSATATYLDPASGRSATYGSGESMRALVPALTANVGVTPWTEAAASRLLGSASAASSVKTAAAAKLAQVLPSRAEIDEAHRLVLESAFTGLFPQWLTVDSLTRMPRIADGASLPDRPAGRYALALAALGYAASAYNASTRSPSLAAARQFARDAADGSLDGRDGEGASVATASQIVYDPGQLRASLDAALAAAAQAHAVAGLRGRAATPLAMGAYALPGSGEPVVVRLDSDGSVVRLGADGSVAAVVANDVAALFSASHAPAGAMFLKRLDGSVSAVGRGTSAGLLALGANVDRAVPEPVAALAGATMISVGSSHALARMPSGKVLGWGSGSDGQLGDGVPSTAQPVTLPALADVIRVLALRDMSLALLQDGRVLAWGQGAAALGQPQVDLRVQAVPQPVRIAGGEPLGEVMALVGFAGASDAAFAALRRDGTVWTWGDNADGGLGAAGASRGVAAKVAGLSGIVGLASTDRGFIAIDAAGALHFWGSVPLDAGSGSPTTYAQPVAPRLLQGLPAARVVQTGFAGLYQARVLTRDGDRWQTDGIGARETEAATELDVHAIGTGIITIGVVAGDDFVNAAERTAGVVVGGIVSEAGRPVTVTVGASSIAAQVDGTAWTATIPATALPTSGQSVLRASFQSATSATTIQASRTIRIDAVGLAATLSDDVPGTAGGDVTFTIAWSEAPQAFGPDDVTVANATKGTFEQLTSTTFSLKVVPPPDAIGEFTVSLAAGAVSDAAGNPSTQEVTSRQAFRTDVTAPTLAIIRAGSSAVTGPFKLTLAWSEPVSGFSAAKVTVTNAQKGTFAQTDPRTYTLMLTPTPASTGTIAVRVDAGVVADAAGNASKAASLDIAFDTTIFSYDYSGGDSSGDSGGESAGSAGDAGSPGALPDPFVVTADTSDGTLRLIWQRHPATNPDPNYNVAYYLVLERDDQYSSLTRFNNAIVMTSSTPADARFDVRVGNANNTASYRIRACNGGSGNTSLPDGGEAGKNWCRDSSEFRLDGSSYPPENFFPGEVDTGERLAVTIGSDGGGWKTGPFTVNFTWNTEVGEFRANDVSVTQGTISNFVGSGRNYSARVTPPSNASGTLTVKVRAGAVRSVSPLPDGHQSEEATVTFSFGSLATTTNAGTPGELAILAGYPTLSTERVTIDGTGLQARFYEAMQMSVDGAGVTWVADYPVIRRISGTGVVTTVAARTAAYNVNPADGPLSSATIRAATALTAAGDGVVYFVDSFNDGYRIRRLNSSGITTLVGAPQGIGVPSGLAYDAPRNLLYVSDSSRHVIWRVALAPTPVATVFAGSLNLAGAQDGTGSAARFYLPGDVAVDLNGNVYVADTGNNVIRKIVPSGSGGVVSLYAGAFGAFEGYVDAALPGDARFGSPVALAVDAASNVYVVEPYNHTVRKISPAGAVTTIVGTGSPGMVNGPLPGGLFVPRDVAVIAGQTLAILGFGAIDPANVNRGFGGMVFVARPAAQWP